MFWRVSPVAAVCLACVAASGSPGTYLELDIGVHAAPALAAHGSDNDWGTKCDLLINPLGLETGGECDSVPPRTSWSNAFGSGHGTVAGVAVGNDWGALRLELEVFHRGTTYDDRQDTDVFDDVTVDKREQEIEQAYGEIDDLRSHAAFVNAYYDFAPSPARWTPYVGIGIGGERQPSTTVQCGSATTTLGASRRSWMMGSRRSSPARLPSATSASTARPLAIKSSPGVDYQLSAQTSLGVKLRWVDFGEFESGETLWSQLRRRIKRRPRRGSALCGDDGRQPVLERGRWPQVSVLGVGPSRSAAISTGELRVLADGRVATSDPTTVRLTIIKALWIIHAGSLMGMRAWRVTHGSNGRTTPSTLGGAARRSRRRATIAMRRRGRGDWGWTSGARVSRVAS